MTTILKFGFWPFPDNEKATIRKIREMVYEYNLLYKDYMQVSDQLLAQRDKVNRAEDELIAKEKKLMAKYEEFNQKLKELALLEKEPKQSFGKRVNFSLENIEEITDLTIQLKEIDLQVEDAERQYNAQYAVLIDLDKKQEKLEDTLIKGSDAIAKYIKRHKLLIPAEKQV